MNKFLFIAVISVLLACNTGDENANSRKDYRIVIKSATERRADTLLLKGTDDSDAYFSAVMLLVERGVAEVDSNYLKMSVYDVAGNNISSTFSDSIKERYLVASKNLYQLRRNMRRNSSNPGDFLQTVKENSTVVDADITDVGFLYISVVNDGTSKDGMALYYCRLAKEKGASQIKAVKIVDAASAHLLKNGTAYGHEIGKAFCE